MKVVSKISTFLTTIFLKGLLIRKGLVHATILIIYFRVWVMVFNATFNSISVILCLISFICWNKAEVPGENRWSLTNLIRYCCIEYTSLWTGFKLTTLVVMIGTDIIVVNLTTIRSWPQRPSPLFEDLFWVIKIFPYLWLDYSFC